MAKASTQGPSGVPAEGAESGQTGTGSHMLNMDKGKRGISQSPVSVIKESGSQSRKGDGSGGQRERLGWAAAA